MGGTTYSSTMRDTRLKASYGADIKSVSSNAIFTQRSINNAMDPHGIVVRESRDSDVHPNSLAIIIALDLTGSMGSVPTFLVKEGLPKIIENIINSGYPDPQVLFIGVGDHECDSAPLQVGQFESGDVELDHWLTNVYLEGGGGGNAGESYLLAWDFAAHHTSIDCFEKREKKGYLFTIGDEPTLKHLPAHVQKSIMGDGQYKDYTADELLDKAMEKYHVYHIHVKETRSGSRQDVMDGWKQIIADGLLVANRHTEIADIISNTVVRGESNDIKHSVKADPSQPIKKTNTEDML